jgi:sulfite exporter TauE/SafE/copper chaperone CopZ
MAESRKCIYSVDGMHCDACELLVEQTAKKIAGVEKVTANGKKHQVTVTLSDELENAKFQSLMNTALKQSGYSLSSDAAKQYKSFFSATNGIAFIIAGAIGVMYLIFQGVNISSYFSATQLTPFNTFILGVIASLTSCMAVIGGVVLSLTASLEKQHKTRAVIVFHIGRLLGFALLGGVTGMLGRMVIISGLAVTLLKIVVAFLMIVVSLDMLGVKLPKVVLPKAIAETLGVFNDKDGITGAFLVGVLTFFLPCAFTQSVQLYALTTRSFLDGMVTMGSFALGTMPVLVLLSVATSVVNIQKFRHSIPHQVIGFLLLFLAVFNVLTALGAS